ncbi:MAG: hypothetical protein LBQ83_01765 [Candidatus Margulisbacteria bacterium]|jgi:hypothetical protein|nr:hypothetical protein [Candidatus Margulisiibacteriota bacterium]
MNSIDLKQIEKKCLKYLEKEHPDIEGKDKQLILADMIRIEKRRRAAGV